MESNIINLENNIVFDLFSSCLIFDYKKEYNFNIYDKIKKNIYDRRFSRFHEKREITSLNIIPSMNCYGKCLYCYNEENNNKSNAFLEFNSIKNNIKNLEKIYNFNLKECRIYGGEPLLHLEIDDLIINLNKNYGIKLFYLSTGLLFSDEHFEKILKKLKHLKDSNISISIGVSLDFGCEEKNFTRKNDFYLNEMDLFYRAIKIINLGINVIFVTTFSKNTNIEKLENDIIKSNKILSHMKIEKDKYFYRFAISCDNVYSPSYDIIDGCYSLLLKNIKNDNMTSNIFPYYDVINSQTIKKINDDIYHIIFKDMPCGIFSNMININSDGIPIHCHMNPYNNIINFDNFEYKNDVIYDKDCDECNYFLVCRGGCFYRKRVSNDVKKKYCYWIKKSFNLALIRLIKSYDNVDNLKEDLNKNIIIIK